MSDNQRSTFNSKIGVIMTTAGSAVGLGNIWKFPYEMGTNGGGAFLLVYIGSVLMLGVPIMLCELLIGRRTHKNVAGAFRQLTGTRKWTFIGVMSLVCTFLIMSFYYVVSGWSIEYILQALENSFVGKTPDVLATEFEAFACSDVRPWLWAALFICMTAGVLLAGIESGIERCSKILMPLLLFILMALGARSILMPNGIEGLRFMFVPDFSKITFEVVLNALGQAFFSLSLGMGCMITYGSYIREEVNLVRTTLQVCIIDMLVAILAGIAIFPAVFSLGIDPSQGSELVFVTLPCVFSQMTGGYYFGVLFFILLAIAAITSTISLMEVITTFAVEEWHVSRRNCLIIMSLIFCITSAFCSLSLQPDSPFIFGGKSLFDWCDFLSANFLMVIGAFCISLFVGWRLRRSDVAEELHKGGVVSNKFIDVFIFLVRYIVPAIIALIFLHGIALV